MNKILFAALASAALAVPFVAHADWDGEDRWVRIHNYSGSYLCSVEISHVDRGRWGPNRFGSCLAPGRYRTVDPGFQQGYCMMDLRFGFDDGSVIVGTDYNICEGEDIGVDTDGTWDETE